MTVDVTPFEMRFTVRKIPIAVRDTLQSAPEYKGWTCRFVACEMALDGVTWLNNGREVVEVTSSVLFNYLSEVLTGRPASDRVIIDTTLLMAGVTTDEEALKMLEAQWPRPATPRSRSTTWKGRGGLSRLLPSIVAFLILVSKIKVLVVPLTMAISVVAYTWALGLGLFVAIGFVLLIFVHEMGHWVAFKWKGVPVSVPYFIPFLGAVINMRRMPESAWVEAQTAIAGPLAGSAAAYV